MFKKWEIEDWMVGIIEKNPDVFACPFENIKQ
jgi:hypothetical protein